MLWIPTCACRLVAHASYYNWQIYKWTSTAAIHHSAHGNKTWNLRVKSHIVYRAIMPLSVALKTRLPVNLQLHTNGSSVRCDAPKSPLDSGIRDIRGGIGVKTGAECCRRASFSLKSGIHCPYDSQLNKSCSINFQDSGDWWHWIFGQTCGKGWISRCNFLISLNLYFSIYLIIFCLLFHCPCLLFIHYIFSGWINWPQWCHSFVFLYFDCEADCGFALKSASLINHFIWCTHTLTWH